MSMRKMILDGVFGPLRLAGRVPFIQRGYTLLVRLNGWALTRFIDRVDCLPAGDFDPAFDWLTRQLVNRFPLCGINGLRYHLLRTESFFAKRLADAPRAIRGFEDLAWLFSCNQANFGIVQMAFDEAAYLYKLARSLESARCLELGRFRGGSTLLLAAALDPRSLVVSIDNYSKAGTREGEEVEAELRQVLARFGLTERVQLVVADSTTVPVDYDQYELIFIDGEHTYSCVRKDWLHVRHSVKPGGHIVFHDGGASRRFATPALGVQRLITEIEEQEAATFTKQRVVGTLVHFQRTMHAGTCGTPHTSEQPYASARTAGK